MGIYSAPTELLENWNFHHENPDDFWVGKWVVCLWAVFPPLIKYKAMNQRKIKSCWRTDLPSPLIWEHSAFLLGNVLLFPQWNVVVFWAARVQSPQTSWAAIPGFGCTLLNSFSRIQELLIFWLRVIKELQVRIGIFCVCKKLDLFSAWYWFSVTQILVA